jgi:hypothetical protein
MEENTQHPRVRFSILPFEKTARFETIQSWLTAARNGEYRSVIES